MYWNGMGTPGVFTDGIKWIFFFTKVVPRKFTIFSAMVSVNKALLISSNSSFSDGEYLFAEPDSKLSKYAPKSWRSSHSHGLDANGRPALAFYFRVQFYVDSPLLLRDEITRQNYYLQLRLNAASGAAGEHSTHLAGLALQVDKPLSQ